MISDHVSGGQALLFTHNFEVFEATILLGQTLRHLLELGSP